MRFISKWVALCRQEPRVAQACNGFGTQPNFYLLLHFFAYVYSVVSQVDLRHMDEKTGSNIVDVGVDLSEFYMSVEWDILEVPAVR